MKFKEDIFLDSIRTRGRAFLPERRTGIWPYCKGFEEYLGCILYAENIIRLLLVEKQELRGTYKIAIWCVTTAASSYWVLRAKLTYSLNWIISNSDGIFLLSMHNSKFDE